MRYGEHTKGKQINEIPVNRVICICKTFRLPDSAGDLQPGQRLAVWPSRHYQDAASRAPSPSSSLSSRLSLSSWLISLSSLSWNIVFSPHTAYQNLLPWEEDGLVLEWKSKTCEVIKLADSDKDNNNKKQKKIKKKNSRNDGSRNI